MSVSLSWSRACIRLGQMRILHESCAYTDSYFAATYCERFVSLSVGRGRHNPGKRSAAIILQHSCIYRSRAVIISDKLIRASAAYIGLRRNLIEDVLSRFYEYSMRTITARNGIRHITLYLIYLLFNSDSMVYIYELQYKEWAAVNSNTVIQFLFRLRNNTQQMCDNTVRTCKTHTCKSCSTTMQYSIKVRQIKFILHFSNTIVTPMPKISLCICYRLT